MSQLQAFWSGTPYLFWGLYIGGDEMSCAQPNLSASYISQITDGASQSWELTLIWVGPQMPYPCTGGYRRVHQYHIPEHSDRLQRG